MASDNYIQVRLTRETRARLTEYAATVATRAGRPANPANRLLSPEECVIRLLDQWEGRRDRSRRSREKGLTGSDKKGIL